MTTGMIVGLVLLFSLCFILMIAGAANEMPFAGMVGFVVVLTVLDVVFNFPILESLKENPLMAGVYLLGYLGAGVVWSFPKWWFYVRKVRDRYVEELEVYRRHCSDLKPGQKMSQAQLSDFAHRYHYENTPWFQVLPVQATRNKSKILSWMVYWPASMVWTLFDQPIRYAFLFCFEQIKGLYQAISDRAFEGVELYQKE